MENLSLTASIERSALERRRYAITVDFEHTKLASELYSYEADRPTKLSRDRIVTGAATLPTEYSANTAETVFRPRLNPKIGTGMQAIPRRSAGLEPQLDVWHGLGEGGGKTVQTSRPQLVHDRGRVRDGTRSGVPSRSLLRLRPTDEHEPLPLPGDCTLHGSWSQGGDRSGKRLSSSAILDGTRLRTAADGLFLATRLARSYKRRFVFNESGLMIAGPGVAWVDQSVLIESRVFTTGPGGEVLVLANDSREPRLYRLVNWPPPDGLEVGHGPGVVWPQEWLPHPALAFLAKRDHLSLRAIPQQPALADGVMLFMPILNEAISPFAVRGFESLGFPAKVAGPLGKGCTVLVVATVMQPWVAPLMAGAMLIHFVSLVLPYGEAGGWSSDKFMMDWSKKALISHSRKTISDLLPFC